MKDLNTKSLNKILWLLSGCLGALTSHHLRLKSLLENPHRKAVFGKGFKNEISKSYLAAFGGPRMEKLDFMASFWTLRSAYRPSLKAQIPVGKPSPERTFWQGFQNHVQSPENEISKSYLAAFGGPRMEKLDFMASFWTLRSAYRPSLKAQIPVGKPSPERTFWQGFQNHVQSPENEISKSYLTAFGGLRMERLDFMASFWTLRSAYRPSLKAQIPVGKPSPERTFWQGFQNHVQSPENEISKSYLTAFGGLRMERLDFMASFLGV